MEMPVYQPPQPEYRTEVEEFVYFDPVKKIKFSLNPLTMEGKIEESGTDILPEGLSGKIIQLRYLFIPFNLFL